MKYVFTFNEINYGRIEIEADRRPDIGEVIEKILEGKASYNDTDFTDFKLIESDEYIGDKPRSFNVTITETLAKTVTVTAGNPCEAEDMVQSEWGNQDHILDANHFMGVKFTAVSV